MPAHTANVHIATLKLRSNRYFRNYGKFVLPIGIKCYRHSPVGSDESRTGFLLVRNALTYSRKTGIYTAIGFGIGIGVHVMYSVLGLGLIISKSVMVYSAIKYAGAAYLMYIGIQSLRSHSEHLDVGDTSHKADISAWKAIRIGFLTNVLNPKATLFFLSLFTIVIGPETSTLMLMYLGIIMMVNTALWFSFLAYLITHSRILPVFEKYQNVFNKVFGGILIAIGVKVALRE